MRNLLAAAMANLDFVGQATDADGAGALRDVRDALHRVSAFSRDLAERSGRPSFRPPTEVDFAEVISVCVRLTSLFARGHRCAFHTAAEAGASCRRAGRTPSVRSSTFWSTRSTPAGARARATSAWASTATASWSACATRAPPWARTCAERIFEPFFTTKGEQGNGVGPAATRALIRGYGGVVRLVG